MPEYDDDTLHRAEGYAGRDFREARNVVREVFGEYATHGWALEVFLSEIDQAVQKIPESYRAVARVQLEGEWDESGKLSIWYQGKETEREVADRVERAITYARHAQARERELYADLKTKFEQ